MFILKVSNWKYEGSLEPQREDGIIFVKTILHIIFLKTFQTILVYIVYTWI